MKKILVPTDFSECADRAIEFAAVLAKKISGEIYLLHVVSDEDEHSGISTSGEWHSVVEATTAPGIPYMIGLLKQTKVIMEEIKKKSFFAGIPVHDNIEVGNAGPMINEAAEKYNADMIVMGTHGAKGITEVLIGSTAEKVVQNAVRPVLAIKERFSHEPSQIIFASDFSSEANNVFGFVKKFAAVFNAKLHLLQVDIGGKDKRGDVKNSTVRFDGAEYPVIVYKDSSKESGILHYAKEINADIIAIGTHGRHGLARFFNPSVSEDLINHAFCPVLTVNFRKSAVL
jgi:nucleotide-binding universal stress UspA family protein